MRNVTAVGVIVATALMRQPGVPFEAELSTSGSGSG